MSNRRSSRKPPAKRPTTRKTSGVRASPPAGTAPPAAEAGPGQEGGFRVPVPADLASAWTHSVPHAGAQGLDPVPSAASPLDSVPGASSPRGIEGYVARNAAQVVPVTYWFDPPAEEVTIRFNGQRVGVTGRPEARDVFQHDERVASVPTGSGPVSVTAKVRGVNPGEWKVTARAVRSAAGSPARRKPLPPVPVFPARWSWRRWALSEGTAAPVRTCPAPFAPQPAVVVGSWAALVLTGILVALVTQWRVLSALDLRLDHVLTVSVPTVLAGAAGGKAWYVMLQRRAGRRQGWAVQGFVTGVILLALPLLLLLRIPPGPYLDASAPGLLFGLAVGRLGCFFTGCCAGRATASRWAVWSSNRRVGARRIPTQLLESALAAGLGVGVLSAVLEVGSRGGRWFIAAVAAYTLVRQAVLQLREERRQSRRGGVLVAAAAAGVLVLDLATLILSS